MPTATSTCEVSPAVAEGSRLVTLASRLVREVRRRRELPAGTRMLSILDEHGPLGVTQLAAVDRCSQPTMSSAVRQLEDQGLVSRQPHPTDSRASLVTMTPHGLDELARVRRLNGETVADLVAGHPDLTAANVATAVRVLEALLTDLHLDTTDPTTDPTTDSGEAP